MVLRGAQIHRRGQAKYSLFSTQSLPHDLAQLYGRTLPFTSANLGGVAGRASTRYRSGPILMVRKLFTATRSRRRDGRLLHNQSPNAEEAFVCTRSLH
jgi:hypothetical protein